MISFIATNTPAIFTKKDLMSWESSNRPDHILLRNKYSELYAVYEVDPVTTLRVVNLTYIRTPIYVYTSEYYWQTGINCSHIITYTNPQGGDKFYHITLRRPESLGMRAQQWLNIPGFTSITSVCFYAQ